MALESARAFGKCSRTGCRHTHVTTLEVQTQGRDAGRAYFRLASAPYPIQACGRYFPQTDAAMRAAGSPAPSTAPRCATRAYRRPTTRTRCATAGA